MGNVRFPWARTVQKPMTGVCGTKPAWQAQKGRGEGRGRGRGRGRGSWRRRKARKGKERKVPLIPSPLIPVPFSLPPNPLPHSTPAMQARTKKVAYKVLNPLCQPLQGISSSFVRKRYHVFKTLKV